MFGAGGRLILDLGSTEAILFTLLLFISIVSYRRTFPPSSRSQRTLLIILRSTAFMLLVIFIADPAFVRLKRVEKDPVIPAMLDISGSMRIKDHHGNIRDVPTVHTIIKIKQRDPI